MVKLLNRPNEKILNPSSSHFNNRLFKLLLYLNLVNPSLEILLEVKFSLKIIIVMIFWMFVVTGIIFGIHTYVVNKNKLTIEQVTSLKNYSLNN